MSSASGKVRPSGFLYLIPVALIIVGVIAAIVSIVNGVNAYSDTIESFARVDSGSSGTIEIDGTGGYTIFYEPGVSDESSLTEDDPYPTVTLTDPSDQPVPLADYDSLGTYGSSGYVGIAVQTFQVDEPGRYHLVASDQVLGGTIAVGRSPFHKITTGVLQAVVFGFVAFVLALVITILLAVSRGRSKRRLRAANPYVAPAWTAAPQAGYPQPGYPQQGYPPYPQQPQYPQPQYPAQPQHPQYPQQPQYPAGPPPGGGQPVAPGGFGPPPSPPAGAPAPAAPPPPPPPPDDDSTPGWGQPQR